jgi:hypothetical protein
MKWFGLALFILGLGLMTRGLLHWSEPPILYSHFYFGTSRQLFDVFGGIAMAVGGAFSFCTGRWLR